MRWLLLPFTALVLLGATPDDDRHRLFAAKRAAAAASARAESLIAATGRERNAARRADEQRQALAARVEAAAAKVRAGEARVALVAQLQDAQRARLAAAQAPAARLLAALTDLARRPAIAAVAQPGSVDDLVHLRAVLGAAMPEIRARAAAVRQELAETRRLQASAAVAVAILRDGRAELERQRAALAALATQHRAEALALNRNALTESDRALAMGEQARDLVDHMSEQGEAQATAADLTTLDGPTPRPLPPGAMPPRWPAAAYRLPVDGVLVTGFGELSPAGARARGLTFAVAPGAIVRAPAGGVVRYAGPFRSYGAIVLVDHGDGWTSLLTGLSDARVRRGMAVAAGAPLGRAVGGAEPQVTVELRRRGRPVDITALIG